MSVRTSETRNWRAVRWGGFYGLVAAAWAVFYLMARGDGGWLCGPDTVALLPLGGFWAFAPMWAVMMAAMMLPTFVPALRVYEDLPAAAGATARGWAGLVTGYGAVWLVGAAGFAAVQVLLVNFGWLSVTGILTAPVATAGLLAVAGFYQLSRGKAACQDACLTPMQYFLGHWRPGFSGGARMGIGLGAYCVGCCWAIMALAFVGGVMSLLWMGLATLFMVMEKLPEIGAHLRRPAGWALLAAAAIVLSRAAIIA